MVCRILRLSLLAAVVAGLMQTAPAANAAGAKRKSTQQKKSDLFANYYVGPCPSGTVAQMYVSPVPVPANVGHTYTTYQPLMPHEMLYKHSRTNYAHSPGAGWNRAKVRYRTRGLGFQHMLHRLSTKY